ncbi:MAG: hypothetical protein KGJ72_10920, partial [Gammaproteobacteria bacterium]|nr:hypothetical protein [Gammaproteobacteria bacterium]
GIRGVVAAVGGGIDLALGALPPALGQMPSSAARESVIAVLNGVLGDTSSKPVILSRSRCTVSFRQGCVTSGGGGR